MKVKIKKIVDELEMILDEHSSYFNISDGEVYTVSDEEMNAAEEGDQLEDFPDWQQENIKIPQSIISEDNYIELPSKFDVHEYAIMEQFCYSIQDSNISDGLQIAIQGKGVFRRFKDACHRFDVIEQWYSYKSEALKDIAISWCNDNNLEYKE